MRDGVIQRVGPDRYWSRWNTRARVPDVTIIDQNLSKLTTASINCYSYVDITVNRSVWSQFWLVAKESFFFCLFVLFFLPRIGRFCLVSNEVLSFPKYHLWRCWQSSSRFRAYQSALEPNLRNPTFPSSCDDWTPQKEMKGKSNIMWHLGGKSFLSYLML